MRTRRTQEDSGARRCGGAETGRVPERRAGRRGRRGRGRGSVQVVRQPEHLERRHPDAAAGGDLGPARPLGHRQVRVPEVPGRPAQAREGLDRHQRRRPGEDQRAQALRDPEALRRAVPGRRPVRLDEPLRQHRLPAARAHQEVRVRDQGRSSSRRWRWSASRAPREAPRRDLRRYAQARRPGPRPGARPRDHPVRRARLRPRPGPRGLPQPADRRPQRPDRRHVPDRHPRHRDGAARCRTTSACCSAATW